MNEIAHIPIDRRLALARDESLPERAHGSVLFADISGFTPLADALVQALGSQRAADEITRQLNRVYDALIGEVHQYHGSVIGFVGDAITCWFDAKGEGSRMMDEGTSNLSSLRAVGCALGMQRAMQSFANVEVVSSVRASFAIKIGIATGVARRFLVGDPQIQLIDTMMGETLRQMAQAEQLAEKGEVVLAPSTLSDLSGLVRLGRSIMNPSTGAQFVVVNELITPAVPTPWDEPAAGSLTEEQIRPWIFPVLYERMKTGQEQFLSQLRAATALFVLFEGIDYEGDETAGAKLDAYIRAVQRIANRYEGNLIQLTIGDKGSFLYIIFGAPVAHDDDPYRAVQAAFELKSASPPISTHIGIAEGQMRVGAYGATQRLTYGAISDVANLANRLMTAAPTGAIRCDYNVYRSASKHIAFEALPPVRVKGMAGLVRVYRPVSRQSPVASRQTEIVGRHAETAEIQTVLDMVQAGESRVLVVEGEAGIGKSRLIAELIRLARERGLTELIGSGHSIEQQTPYHAWRDVFSTYIGLDNVTDATERRELVRQLASQLAPDQVQRLPLLNDVLGLGLTDNELTSGLEPQFRQQSLQILLMALLRAWAIKHPLILILEDAHWLDGLSWQLAIQVVRSLSLAHARFLLVIVNRPLDETSTEQSIFRELHAMDITHTLALSPLAPTEITALIANRLGVTTDALPAPLAQLVQSRANGNPFFAEELVFNLRDTGIITVEQSTEYATRITITTDLEHSTRTLPDTLHGLILARIDRLPSERQFVLKVAAVIGRAFAYAPLHHTLNHYSAMVGPVLKDHLNLLTTADFTLLESIEPDLTYIFKHIITQEAAYQTLLFAQRRELHRLVAEWFEAREDAKAFLPLLTYHYHQVEDWEKELHYARLAGEQAAKQYANAEAIRFLSRALELTSPDDLQTRFDLLVAREALYHRQGRRDMQAQDMAELQTLANGLSPEAHLRVTLLQARYAESVTDYEQAIQYASKVVADAKSVGDWSTETDAHLLWGHVLVNLQMYEPAQEHFKQVLELARRGGNRAQEAEALRCRAILDVGREPAERMGDLQLALQINRELDDRVAQARTLHGIANIFNGWLYDYDRARQYYLDCIALCRQTGDRDREASSLLNLAFTLRVLGKYQDARQYYEQTLAIGREISDRKTQSLVLCAIGTMACEDGEYAQAVKYLEETLQISEMLNDRGVQAMAKSDLAEIYRLQGDYDRAESLFQQALDLRADIGLNHSPADDLCGLARVMFGRGDMPKALAYIGQFMAHLVSNPVLDGTHYPARDVLTAYRILRTVGDPHASELIVFAYNELQSRAAKITNPALRVSFLENVPDNREIINAYEQQSTGN